MDPENPGYSAALSNISYNSLLPIMEDHKDSIMMMEAVGITSMTTSSMEKPSKWITEAITVNTTIISTLFTIMMDKIVTELAITSQITLPVSMIINVQFFMKNILVISLHVIKKIQIILSILFFTITNITLHKEMLILLVGVVKSLLR